MKTYDNELSYLFDEAIATRVVALLNEFDIPAVVEEYEPGMHQVRLDPTTPGDQQGWMFVAGQGDDMSLGWFAIRTADHGHGFETVEGFTTLSLGLPVSAEPAAVATRILAFLAEQG